MEYCIIMMEHQRGIHDNAIKDNIAMTSSNLSRIKETITILTHFITKNHSKLPKANKIIYSSVVALT